MSSSPKWRPVAASSTTVRPMPILKTWRLYIFASIVLCATKR